MYFFRKGIKYIELGNLIWGKLMNLYFWSVEGEFLLWDYENSKTFLELGMFIYRWMFEDFRGCFINLREGF